MSASTFAAGLKDRAKFVVFGDGELRTPLERRGEAVIFAGTREAKDIYAAIDIVALTSMNEGTPLAIIEALMAGKPVVSTAVGGVVDLLGPVQEHCAGYDIREEEGFEATIQALNRAVGTKNVRAVHFNDSRAPYNSRVDRHWHIGEGHIGTEALRRVARHPKLVQAAFILETPYDNPKDDIRNLEMLRSFVRLDAASDLAS